MKSLILLFSCVVAYFITNALGLQNEILEFVLFGLTLTIIYIALTCTVLIRLIISMFVMWLLIYLIPKNTKDGSIITSKLIEALEEINEN